MSQNTIGERIKHHRKRLGMTQEQLAERMGVTPQAVSKWETNQSCPDISALPQLAELFGISVDELLGKEPAHRAEVVDEDDDDDEDDGRGLTFEWKRSGKRSALWFALYILAVGGLILTNYILKLDVSNWSVVWMTALVMIGLSITSHKFSLFGIAVALGGAYFLLNAYHVLPAALSWGIIIPVGLILWGISLLIDVLFGKRRAKRIKKHLKHMTPPVGKQSVQNCSCDGGRLNCEMSFGSHHWVAETPMLQGGVIETQFGDCVVDLTKVQAVAPECRITVENSFGELTLRIPSRFGVELTRDESFAATTVKGSPAPQTEGTLLIDAEVSFGHLDILYVD